MEQTIKTEDRVHKPRFDSRRAVPIEVRMDSNPALIEELCCMANINETNPELARALSLQMEAPLSQREGWPIWDPPEQGPDEALKNYNDRFEAYTLRYFQIAREWGLIPDIESPDGSQTKTK